MSQVTIHHPSSYGYSGQVGLPTTVTGGSSATFSFQSLLPGAHTVTWNGGAPTTNAITVAADGTASAAHTYPAGPGTYTMFVTEDATGRRVAQRTITLPYSGTGGFAPRSFRPPTEPPPADPPPETPAEPFDPSAHTVQEVKDYVTAHPDEAEDILADEEASQDRVTLVSWLESFIAAQP